MLTSVNLLTDMAARVCICATHRLVGCERDSADLLGDELKLGVVPLPLPLVALQAGDQVRTETFTIKQEWYQIILLASAQPGKPEAF